jgi:hypothetical protein
MANEEQQEPEPNSGLYASAAAATPQRRNQRRKQAIVGVTGAAAVLAGAVFLAVQLNDSDQENLPEPAAMAPQTTSTTTATQTAMPGASSDAASVAPSVTRTSKVPKPADAVERSPSPKPSRSREATPDAAESPAAGTVKDLRSKLSMPQEGGAVNERTEALRNGTIRIVTAKRDLTGQRELLLAGDEGKSVGGGVTCTSNVKINAAVEEVQQPTMLLCWKTSKSRSVVTMAVIPKGDPPTQASADIIGKEWAELD